MKVKLEILNIYATSKDKKEILKNFSLKINDGESHVIMGPNGVGKSTLSKIIMGSNDYVVNSGNITFKDHDITTMETSDRANLGIFLAMQHPISIEGISNSEFLKTAVSSNRKIKVGIFEFMNEMEDAMKELSMDPKMMHRSINQDFSGGERKKNEILQMKLLKPDLIILDELDSGLDIDSLKIVCQNINKYIEENPKTSVLIITHYPKILDYLNTDYVHIMKDGKIVKTGTKELAKEIEEIGYSAVGEEK